MNHSSLGGITLLLTKDYLVSTILRGVVKVVLPVATILL